MDSMDNKQATSGDKKATLYRMVMEDHLCPYGLKSKDLLEREGFKVENHHLETREETDVFQEKHSVETTLQTWIAGKSYGGYEALREYFGKQVKIATTPATNRSSQYLLSLS